MATDNVDRRFSKVATDPLRSFRFYVEFFNASSGGGTADSKIASFAGGFVNVSGLGINTQSISYREGGFNTTIHQIPGMTTFNPITLNRGVIQGNDNAMRWMRYLFASTAGDGLALSTTANDFRCDLKIYVLDHPNAALSGATTGATGAASSTDGNNPKLGFWVHNAWISTLNYSDLDAGGNNVMVETMGLVHEGLSVFYTSSDYTPIALA
jgi:phage tail-like protein